MKVVLSCNFFFQGNQDVMLVIYVSPKLPIHIVSKLEAEDFYNKNIGTDVLGVGVWDVLIKGRV